MNEALQMRVHGDPNFPTLVYLPGLHGDWTLVGSFRHALQGRVRFVEITYPRTLTWSLEDYAAAVACALESGGIREGWLLAESFGSQVAWPLLREGRFRVQGLVLAGGFVRHPMPWAARLAEHICGGVSLRLLKWILFGYAALGRWRFRHNPELLQSLEEFIARRTEPDRDAAKHRLRLVAESDWCALARVCPVPVYAITGLADPIVPWMFVRRWLKRNCPALRDYCIVWQADHNVLSTAPRQAAHQVLYWIGRPSLGAASQLAI